MFHRFISSTHLASYIVVTILLTLFPMLYFTSPWLLCNYQCALPNPFTIFTQLPNPSPLTAISLFSLSTSLFLFCYILFLRCVLKDKQEFSRHTKKGDHSGSPGSVCEVVCVTVVSKLFFSVCEMGSFLLRPLTSLFTHYRTGFLLVQKENKKGIDT